MSISGSVARKRSYSTMVPAKTSASSRARSRVRLVTKISLAPERCRWRAASSDILPAPTIMTLFAASVPKISRASSTAA